MKIFSLESKTSLVLWSLFLAVALNFLPLFQFFIAKPLPLFGQMSSKGSFVFYSGWPLQYSWEGTAGGLIIGDLFIVQNFLLDLIFWIVVVFIILSLVRYFTNKKVLAKTI